MAYTYGEQTIYFHGLQREILQMVLLPLNFSVPVSQRMRLLPLQTAAHMGRKIPVLI